MPLKLCKRIRCADYGEEPDKRGGRTSLSADVYLCLAALALVLTPACAVQRFVSLSCPAWACWAQFRRAGIKAFQLSQQGGRNLGEWKVGRRDFVSVALWVHCHEVKGREGNTSSYMAKSKDIPSLKGWWSVVWGQVEIKYRKPSTLWCNKKVLKKYEKQGIFINTKKGMFLEAVNATVTMLT